MKKVKRVLAFLGCALVLISTLVVSVSAYEINDKTSAGSQEADRAAAALFAQYYDFEDNTAAGMLVNTVIEGKNLRDFTAFFTGHSTNSRTYYDISSSDETAVISQGFLRGFADGYRSNECLDTAYFCAWVYADGADQDVAGYGVDNFLLGGDSDVYFDLRYNGNTYFTFMLRNNPEYRSVELIFKPCEVYIGNGGNNVCEYYLWEVRFNTHIGTAIRYGEGYNLDLSIAFYDNQGRFYTPDYVTSTLLGSTSQDGSYSGHYRSDWRFPRYEYNAIRAHYVKIWNDSHNVAFGEGYDVGYVDGEQDGFEDGYDSGFSTGEIVGNESGYAKGYTDGESDGYSSGYDIGHGKGYKDAVEKEQGGWYLSGYLEGEEDGYNIGYGDGFDEGQTDGLEASTNFGDLVIGIFEAPLTLINGMLDFDFLGINVAGLVKVLLTLGVTAAIMFAVLKITRG